MIIKPNQMSFENQKYNVLIAGFPGIGKTTLALSAPKPLLLDFDKGISRVDARFRKDTAEVQTYEELLTDLESADLNDYETIVVDTGARLLDLMKDWAIRKEPKNGQTDGNLTLKGYGVVGKEFMRFINSIKYKLNKHCVVIFHCSEQKDNEMTKLRITIEGQSRENIWQPMDLGGFMEVIGKDHTIGFTNCERYFAKGSHGVKGIWTIPNPEETGENNFLTKLFDKMTETLQASSDLANKEKAEYEKIIAEIKPKIDTMTEETIKDVQDVITNAKHISTSKKELTNMFRNKLESLGMKWDGKNYVKK